MEKQILDKLNFETLRFSGLVKYIVKSLDEDNVNLEFVNFFFCFYKLYITPEKLFYYLTKNKETRGLMEFLNLWILCLFDKDFSPPFVGKVINFLIVCSAKSDLLFYINKVKLSLLRKTKDKKLYPLVNPPPSNRSFFSFPPIKVAEQMLIIELEILSRLHLSEFMSKNNKPILNMIIKRTNQISLWVASNILIQKKISNQIKVIRFFLEIAQFCEIWGNFNSLFDIMSGFQFGYIARLRENWKLKSQYALMMNRFQKLTNPEYNYKTYRGIISSLEGKKIIPYIGIVKKDIFVISDSNPNYIGKRINKNKLELIAGFVNMLPSFKSTFEKDPRIQYYLLSLNRWEEDKIEQRSKEIKPYKGSNLSEERDNIYAEYNVDNISKGSDDSETSELLEIKMSD